MSAGMVVVELEVPVARWLRAELERVRHIRRGDVLAEHLAAEDAFDVALRLTRLGQTVASGVADPASWVSPALCRAVLGVSLSTAYRRLRSHPSAFQFEGRWYLSLEHLDDLRKDPCGPL